MAGTRACFEPVPRVKSYDMSPTSSSLLTLERGVRRLPANTRSSMDVLASKWQAERVVALIGPSGAGKSSLPARRSTSSSRPARGRILLEGQEVGGTRRTLDALRRDVGMVFQSFNLFPHLTALEKRHARSRTHLGNPEGAGPGSSHDTSWAHVGLADHANCQARQVLGRAAATHRDPPGHWPWSRR